jgi:hypothetical protein
MSTSTEQPDLNILDGMIWGSAMQLHENIRNGYTDGYEIQLADAVLADDQLRDVSVSKALEMLLGERMNEFITVDCLLDETQPGSYVITEEMTRIMLSEIARQENEYDALRRLIVAAIVDRERAERVPEPANCLGCGQTSLKAYPEDRSPSHGYICVHCVENLGQEQCERLIGKATP